MKTQNFYRTLFSLGLIVLSQVTFAGNNNLKGSMHSTNINELSVMVEEENLSIESWMTDDRIWYSDSFFMEKDVAIDDWMTNEQTWALKPVVIENELSIQNWMTDNLLWFGNSEIQKASSFDVSSDDELGVEAWMINDLLWRIQ